MGCFFLLYREGDIRVLCPVICSVCGGGGSVTPPTSRDEGLSCVWGFVGFSFFMGGS